MNKLLAILSLSFLGYVIAALANQVRLIKQMEFNIEKYQIIKFTFKNAIIRLFLRITNPSKIDIDVKAYDITAYINDISVANFKNKIKKTISPKKTVILPLEIQFSPKRVLQVAIQKDFISGLLLDKKKLKISLKGVFSMSHKFIHLSKVPLDYSTTLFELQEEEPTT